MTNQPSSPVYKPCTIEAHHRVADVLCWFPDTQQVFDRLGLGLLRYAVVRRTIARRTTLAQAAAKCEVPLADVLAAMRAAGGLPDRVVNPESTCTGRCHCCPHQHAHAIAGVTA